MLKIVIFHVLYAISVSLTIRGMDVVSEPSVGPTRQWEREKIPFFLSSSAAQRHFNLSKPMFLRLVTNFHVGIIPVHTDVCPAPSVAACTLR
jgi:hypothetical protein